MNLPKKSGLYIFAAVCLGLITTAGAWTDAPANPPANNVAAPLNVGSNLQIKEGGLDIRGLLVQGKGVFSTSSYSFPSNATFAVNGAIAANAYCDVNGQNCKGAGEISAVTGGLGGDKIICGGWDTKYGAGTVDGSQWGCVPTGATSCPAGYDVVSSSHVTINLAEQTNLCVLSSGSGGGSSSTIFAGWPNTIVCNATNGNKKVLPLDGYFPNGRNSYGTNAGYTYGSPGDVLSLYFDAATRKVTKAHGNGDYGNVTAEFAGCFTLGASIDDAQFTKY